MFLSLRTTLMMYQIPSTCTIYQTINGPGTTTIETTLSRHPAPSIALPVGPPSPGAFALEGSQAQLLNGIAHTMRLFGLFDGRF